jgi:hypothetical protein
VLQKFYLIAIGMCLVSLCVLLLSPAERENFFLTRFIFRKLFSRLDFHARHKRINQIAGGVLAVFAIGLIVAFVLTKFGNR